jgi:DNA-binding MarR family transcriptional regulator
MIDMSTSMSEIDKSMNCFLLPHPRIIKTFIDKEMNGRLAPYGVTASQGPFILAIGQHDGINLKQLSDEVMVDKALTTRTVKLLIDNGLAENTGNGSRYSIVLTDRGRDMCSVIGNNLHEVTDMMTSDLSREELETFRICMTKIHRTLADKIGTEEK